MWPFKSKKEPEPTGPFVERRRIYMVSKDGSHTATDYVPLDYVAAYVEDAKTRWGTVSVGSKHDSGPGGDYGPAVIPDHLHEIKARLESEPNQ